MLDTLNFNERISLRIVGLKYTGNNSILKPLTITSKCCNTAAPNLDFQNTFENFLTFGFLSNNELDCQNNSDHPIITPFQHIKFYVQSVSPECKLELLKEFDKGFLWVKLQYIK